MTLEEKIQLAVRLCEERAANTTGGESMGHALYGKIVPIVAAWEVEQKGAGGNDYITALLMASATLLSQGVRSVASDNPQLKEKIWPDVLRVFIDEFHNACFADDALVCGPNESN